MFLVRLLGWISDWANFDSGQDITAVTVQLKNSLSLHAYEFLGEERYPTKASLVSHPVLKRKLSE